MSIDTLVAGIDFEGSGLTSAKSIRVSAGVSFGAFSTQGDNSLDSGGDAVPDGTQSLYGPDPDLAVPVRHVFPVVAAAAAASARPAALRVVRPLVVMR